MVLQLRNQMIKMDIRLMYVGVIAKKDWALVLINFVSSLPFAINKFNTRMAPRNELSIYVHVRDAVTSWIMADFNVWHSSSCQSRLALCAVIMTHKRGLLTHKSLHQPYPHLASLREAQRTVLLSINLPPREGGHLRMALDVLCVTVNQGWIVLLHPEITSNVHHVTPPVMPALCRWMLMCLVLSQVMQLMRQLWRNLLFFHHFQYAWCAESRFYPLTVFTADPTSGAA